MFLGRYFVNVINIYNQLMLQQTIVHKVDLTQSVEGLKVKD